MDERLKKLRSEVDALLKWKADDERQQIQFPTGNITEKIIQTNHMVVQKNFIIDGSTPVAIEVILDNDIFYVPAIIN